LSAMLNIAARAVILNFDMLSSIDAGNVQGLDLAIS
jgi:hypothetical protein